MLRPKKNSYKEYDNGKKFLRLKNSPPSHNFSNGPSLNVPVKYIGLNKKGLAGPICTFWQMINSPANFTFDYLTRELWLSFKQN